LVSTAKNIIFLDPAIATELLIEPRMMKKFRMNMGSISPKFEKKLESQAHIEEAEKKHKV
jgi:hypothetical protein